MAAAKPAGPPPTITTSVFEFAKLIQFTSRFHAEGKTFIEEIALSNKWNRLWMDALIVPDDAYCEVSSLPRICIEDVNNAAAELVRLLI